MDAFHFGDGTLADIWMPIYREVYSEFAKRLLEVVYYEAFTSASRELSANLSHYNLRIPDPEVVPSSESVGEALRNFKIELRQKWELHLRTQRVL